jgi:predicted RNA polymerase sigma factor
MKQGDDHKGPQDGPRKPGRYADLRKQITRLGEARRHYHRAVEVAAEAAVRRNRERFERLLAETRRMADDVLQSE